MNVCHYFYSLREKLTHEDVSSRKKKLDKIQKQPLSKERDSGPKIGLHGTRRMKVNLA